MSEEFMETLEHMKQLKSEKEKEQQEQLPEILTFIATRGDKIEKKELEDIPIASSSLTDHTFIATRKGTGMCSNCFCWGKVDLPSYTGHYVKRCDKCQRFVCGHDYNCQLIHKRHNCW